MRYFQWLTLLGVLTYTNAEKLVDPTHKEIIDFDQKISELWDAHTVNEDGIDASFDITIDGAGVHTIMGKMMMSNIEQRPIYAFQGFRYGKIPNRQTKFKPPVPEDFPFWEGDQFDATHIGFKCPQNAMIGSTIAGRTDCLYLNVYTPYLPTSEDANGLPVMFFIHGGSFRFGDASLYLPTKLLEHDVILVTIHYRLGAQGFFTLNNEDAPGNTALYDMIEALRWTQAHIEDFGGDPNKVTIFGESAGSAAVNYLMLSPVAEGLFRSVIGESGSAIDYWALDEDPSIAADFIMNYVGCDQFGTEAEKFDCMLDASEEDLVRALNQLSISDKSEGGSGFSGSAPTVQLPFATTDNKSLVPRPPLEILYDEDYRKVPFMTGANRDEGSYYTGLVYKTYIQKNDYTNDPVWRREEMIQEVLIGFGIVDNTRAVQKSLTNYYCPDKDLADLEASSACINDMVGSIFLKAGSWQTSNFHSRSEGTAKTFYYSFEFDSEDSMYLWLLGAASWETGITHSDEMMYIFSMPATMEVSNNQQLTEKRMALTWTNFAKYGDPTPDEDRAWASDPFNLPKWQSFDKNEPHYIIIDDDWTIADEFSDAWAIDANQPAMLDNSARAEIEDKADILSEMSPMTMSSEMPSMSMSSKMPSMSMSPEMPSMSMSSEMPSMSMSSEMPSMSMSSEMSTMSLASETTTVPEKPVTTPEMCYTEDEYKDVKYERDAYLATMNVFIILFAIEAGCCIYLFMMMKR